MIYHISMDENRLKELERKVEMLERALRVQPTQNVMDKPLLIRGVVYADRVYTKRSGNYVELTT